MSRKILMSRRIRARARTRGSALMLAVVTLVVAMSLGALLLVTPKAALDRTVASEEKVAATNSARAGMLEALSALDASVITAPTGTTRSWYPSATAGLSAPGATSAVSAYAGGTVPTFQTDGLPSQLTGIRPCTNLLAGVTLRSFGTDARSVAVGNYGYCFSIEPLAGVVGGDAALVEVYGRHSSSSNVNTPVFTQYEAVVFKPAPSGQGIFPGAVSTVNGTTNTVLYTINNTGAGNITGVDGGTTAPSNVLGLAFDDANGAKFNSNGNVHNVVYDSSLNSGSDSGIGGATAPTGNGNDGIEPSGFLSKDGSTTQDANKGSVAMAPMTALSNLFTQMYSATPQATYNSYVGSGSTIPTAPIIQVNASGGGKQGINITDTAGAIGTLANPVMTIIKPDQAWLQNPTPLLTISNGSYTGIVYIDLSGLTPLAGKTSVEFNVNLVQITGPGAGTPQAYSMNGIIGVNLPTAPYTPDGSHALMDITGAGGMSGGVGYNINGPINSTLTSSGVQNGLYISEGTGAGNTAYNSTTIGTVLNALNSAAKWTVIYQRLVK